MHLDNLICSHRTKLINCPVCSLSAVSCCSMYSGMTAVCPWPQWNIQWKATHIQPSLFIEKYRQVWPYFRTVTIGHVHLPLTVLKSQGHCCPTLNSSKLHTDRPESYEWSHSHSVSETLEKGLRFALSLDSDMCLLVRSYCSGVSAVQYPVSKLVPLWAKHL